ncbi:MAG: lamin tail domain-containing protein, partial [Planctomycetota bacterium]
MVFRCVKVLLPAVVAAAFSVGSVKADCPSGDLNGDCRVDLLDVQILAGQWLAPSESCPDTGCADLDGVDGVNMSDLALLARNWYEAGIPLVINEVMASNRSSIRDPQGEYDDWIEIYNAGLEPINVGGMYLTDNPDDPTKWRIPTNSPGTTTIAADGYLLIWADDDAGAVGLHTNFKLNADGEQVALFAHDGITLIHSLEFGNQTSDISFGSYPDGAGNSRFLAKPTPRGENDGAYLGEVEAPQFSHKRGFYDRPFLVTLATETEGATIHYTLDGAVPHESFGRVTTGDPYIAPISIHKTTCLRVKAVKPGWKDSAVKTVTYVLNASDEVKSLPLISLVGDERRTFYEPDGVMAIVGGSYGGNGTWVSSGPASHNNPMRRGMEYERPVSCEWIMPEDNSGFQVDCGLRVHGSDYMRPRYRRQNGYWTGNGKFAFRLYFRDRYGPSWLEYPLFPFEVERFKSIVLRGGHNDRVNPFIKDELMRRLQKDMGHVASGGTMANLFINGEYKGYFNPCEHIKDAFCQQWYGGGEAWDVMTMSGIRDGDAVSWNALLNYARNNNLSYDVHYEYVSKRLDIPAFIDYLILQLWGANWDWPQNNWSAAAEHSEDGVWRFFVWDAEGTFGPGDLNKSGFTDFPSWAAQPSGLNNLSTPIAWFYRALKANDGFRQEFADRLNRHFYGNGALTEANVTGRFLELRDQMQGVIPNMDRYTLTGWLPNRPNIFLGICAREGLFATAGPTFSVNGVRQHGGRLSSGDTLTMRNTGRSQEIYYTLDGSDPRPEEQPQPISITNTVLLTEHADKRAFVPIGPMSENWKGGGFFDDSAWAHGTGGPGGVGFERRRSRTFTSLISLNVEQQMHRNSATCYIRIPFVFDGVPAAFDLMTLRIKYNDGFVAYLNGVEVGRGNFTGTPVWNSHADDKRSDAAALQFEDIDISASLDALRYGNNVLAIHGLNSSMLDQDFFISVELLAGEVETDNSGQTDAFLFAGPITLPHSAKIKARTLVGRSWSALTEATYSVGPVADNLRITEIMYHPSEPNEEFIELTNVGTESINLNLASFTDGVDFVFPNLELAPGERTVVVHDTDAFAARYQVGRQAVSVRVAGQYSGRLDNAGERI